MNYRPVFIGGCDRSGTTLLGDLLGNSPWTLTTPESQFMHEFLIHLKLGSLKTGTDMANWLHNHFRFAAWGLQVSRDEIETMFDLKAPRSTLETIIERYAEQYHPHKSQADVWVDHTPDSFKYHAMLKTQFPEARFIHIVRDGRAVCASIKHLDWGPNNAYSASRHWANRLEQALTVESAEGDNCYRVRFEDLVANPEKVLAGICSFIDIPFDESMLQGGGLALPEFTRKQHQLVGQKPQADKAQQWRKKLSLREIRDFESYPFSRTLLSQMGYTLEFPDIPKLSMPRVLNRYCHEFICYLINRFNHRKMERHIVHAYKFGNDAKKKTIATTPVNPNQYEEKLS